MSACVVCLLLGSRGAGAAYVTHGHSVCADHVEYVVASHGDVSKAVMDAKIDEDDL